MNKNEMSYELINRLSLKSKKKITPKSKTAQIYCPFHQEKNASMFIDMDRGIYHCFSCRRKGTINNLSKELTGENIYKFLSIKFDEFQEYSKIQYKKVEDLSKIPSVRIKESDNGEARGIHLEFSRKINAFLRRRGLTKEIVKAFKMYEVSNLVKYNETRYRDRVCIPIYEGGKLLSIFTTDRL